MGLLDASRRRRGLASSLCGKLLARSLRAERTPSTCSTACPRCTVAFSGRCLRLAAACESERSSHLATRGLACCLLGSRHLSRMKLKTLCKATSLSYARRSRAPPDRAKGGMLTGNHSCWFDASTKSSLFASNRQRKQTTSLHSGLPG